MNKVDRMEEQLDIHLSEDEIKESLIQNHISQEEWAQFSGFLCTIYPLLKPTASFCYVHPGEGPDEITYEEYIVAFLTLGPDVDALQQFFLDRYCLMQGYYIDCIGLALLKKAYEELVRLVQTRTGKWVQKLVFLGDTYPVELLPQLHELVAPTLISYTQQLMLSPEKSVVLLLPLESRNKFPTVGQREASENEYDCEELKKICDICHNCGNMNCVLRKERHDLVAFNRKSPKDMIRQKQELPQNYGFSRIFGTHISGLEK